MQAAMQTAVSTRTRGPNMKVLTMSAGHRAISTHIIVFCVSSLVTRCGAEDTVRLS